MKITKYYHDVNGRKRVESMGIDPQAAAFAEFFAASRRRR
jgi:hypothetical protein